MVRALGRLPTNPPPPPPSQSEKSLKLSQTGLFLQHASGRGNYTVHAKESEDSQISLTEVVASTYILQGSRKSQ